MREFLQDVMALSAVLVFSATAVMLLGHLSLSTG